MPADCTLRPIEERDLPFLERLYASTRAEELAPVPWSAEQKEAFLHHQFDAQHRHYQQHFRDARFDVIERGGRPLGRLYVERQGREIRVIDIAVVPEERGHGLGTALLEGLLEEARLTGKTVTIHVEHMNRARRLYDRLGFRQIADEGVYLFLEWSAPA